MALLQEKKVFLQKISIFLLKNGRKRKKLMKKNILLMLLALAFPFLHVSGQRHQTFADDIRSLRVSTSRYDTGLPVIELRSGEYVNIAFDVMSHDYRRFTYTVSHCEADWSPSESLFESDYIEGFSSGMVIEDCEKSVNTGELYSHYTLSVPNRECRLSMSGNYILTVYDNDADDAPVLRVCFMVVESRMSASLTVSPRTDKEINGRYQQADVQVGYNGVSVTSPERQVKVVVMQNWRWSTARTLPRPQAYLAQGMQWYHCKDLIFPATNEYRKFEYLDLRRNTMGVENSDFDGDNYIVNLYRDYPRPHYVYDEDANGAFFIRNFYNNNNDTESEYFLCNFSYHAPEPFKGEVYLNGQWTNDRLLPEYRMEYFPEEQCYRCTVMLKMGYYSYQYVMEKPDGEVVYLPAEGDFYQTENHYSCLVYYRPMGGRTDLLYAVCR